MTSPVAPAVGDPITAAYGDIVARWGQWTSFVPALTASTTSPTLGSGSAQVGGYTAIGKLIQGWALIQFGTSGVVAGSGNYSVSLPVPSFGGSVIYGQFVVGAAGLFTRGDLYFNTTSTCFLKYPSAAVNGAITNVTNAAPGAWAASNPIYYNFTYQAA